jgi:hypothetical protein
MLANDDLGNLGRLGNQMFQYASLRGLAKKHGYDYCLPPRSVVGSIDYNCLNSDITIFECFKLPDTPKLITNFPKVMESTFALDQNLWDNCPDNISLYGYFQTEKYFSHIEDDIRKDFTFVDEIFAPTKQAFDENFSNNDVISLHIRRGDYLKAPHHPVQSLEYYSDALNIMPNDVPVIIFSDDLEWCKEQKLFEDERFIFSESNSTGIDLCLQSFCTHHIIANSSFSWWGAWLANSKNVVAPKKWFAGSHINHNTKDLYCSKWISI